MELPTLAAGPQLPILAKLAADINGGAVAQATKALVRSSIRLKVGFGIGCGDKAASVARVMSR